MIDNLYELNQVIYDVVNRIVDISTQQTTTGNWVISHDDVADIISEEDYLQYFDLIANELSGRDEVLDMDTSDHQFDCVFGLAYCPHYEWEEGDEKVFNCTKEEWEKNFRAQPICHPLSLNRLADIGENAIIAVQEWFDDGIDELTESLGMSMEELQQLGIYDPVPDELDFTYEVLDPQKNRSAQFDNFDDALKAYQAIGSSELKTLNVLLPKGQEREGSVVILQQQNGDDQLFNTHTDLEHIREIRDLFKDTPVEAAFERAKSFVISQWPIAFCVDSYDIQQPIVFKSFEEALKKYNRLGSEDGKTISCMVNDEKGSENGSILLRYYEALGKDIPCLLKKEPPANPHVALAEAKAVLTCYPNDADALVQRDYAEAKLGTNDHNIDQSMDVFVGKWRVHMVPTGGHYGSHNQLVNKDKPLVEFYDMTKIHPDFSPNGQHTGGRYYIDTLLGRDGWSKSEHVGALSLDGDVPAWTVSAAEMRVVMKHLKDFVARVERKPSLGERIDQAEGKKRTPDENEDIPRRPER